MTQKVADRDYWADADGNLVDADDPNAAFLVARAGTAVSDAAAQRYGLDRLTEAEAYDAVADHAAKHGGETDAQAAEARQRMLSPTGGDDDGPAVEGERDEKALPRRSNKAAAAPEHKAE